MDLVAGPLFFWLQMAVLIWCMTTGLVSGLVHRKTGSVVAASFAGVLPVVVLWVVIAAVMQVAKTWPDPPQITVINGKSYTAETLPLPKVSGPQNMPIDNPKNLDFLQTFGIEPIYIDFCRKKGCRVDFTARGGISNFSPLKNGDWQYALDPATDQWKVKE